MQPLFRIGDEPGLAQGHSAERYADQLSVNQLNVDSWLGMPTLR
jgi:hypothetical protein